MPRGVDQRFLALMRQKLERGRVRGRDDWDDRVWSECASSLLDRLKEEVGELEYEMGKPIKDAAGLASRSRAVALEAADVANFAMFIADYNNYGEPPPGDGSDGR